MAGYHYSVEESRALLPWAEAGVVAPSPLPDCAVDRVRGMLWGVAVGDSLGNTSEGMQPDERRCEHGEIRGYLPHPREDFRRVGFPSDDTQLTFWTVASLLRRGHLDPGDLAESFVGPRIFGVGKTMTEFLFAYRFGCEPWFRAGRPSAGNGALMRMAPVLLPHVRDMSMALWRDVVAATVLTHRDEAAVAASAGFLGLLSECLAWSSGAPPGRWWPETFLRYAEPMEVEHAEYTARVPGDVFAGGLCARVEQTVLPAVDAGWAVLECTQRWHSGAYLLETVPCVLHILARHGADPEEAIIRAVNDTSDNDTIASVVGAAVGALHGAAALPSRWKESLLGRTFEADDGQVQALTERAIETFVL